MKDNLPDRADGSALYITEIRRRRPPNKKTVDDISQLLQNHGYEGASKFLDCAYGL